MDIMGSTWQLRRPEYTGENRCIPCTAVNAVLTLVLAAAVAAGALVAGLDGPVAAAGAVAVAVVGTVAIVLRGYLVPGTPTLTQRYLPDRVLAYFDKAPAPRTDAGDLDAEGLLVDHDVVTECDDVDDLCLTDDFDDAWSDAIDARRELETSTEDLAGLLGVEQSSLELTEHGDAVLVRFDGRRVGQWESDAAYIADMAAAAVLGERIPTWGQLAIEDRSRLLQGLRPFLEACPVCTGPLSLEEETVSSCCRSIEVVAMSCGGCDRRLMEMEHPTATA